MLDPISRMNAALEGQYVLERELGNGGTATVYLATDVRHQRQVAVKVLSPDLTAALGAQRFLNEIRTTANLNHPHILPLFDSGEADGFLYYVMPYVEGESLRARLERGGELPIDESLRIVAALADALDYAHHQGVIHRDIKPGNILLQDGKALLSDFGIALGIDAAGGDRITGTGHSVGTPYYMSPEQVSPHGDVDGRADIYSLACVLHEMLAGEPVFSGPTPRAVLAKHLTVPPVPVRTLRSRVPPAVERAILRALEKSPTDRFRTMDEFAAALDRSASTVSVRTAWSTLGASVRAHPVAAGAAALAIAGAVWLAISLLDARANWTDYPSSVVVLPFREAGATDADSDLAARLAAALTEELHAWDGIDAAAGVDLVGPLRDLALGEGALTRIDDGVAVARAIDAQAMLAVSVRTQADSATVRVLVHDARSSRRVGEPIFTTASVTRVTDFATIAPIVATVLGLGDAPEPARALRAGTRDPAAAREYLHGLEELGRNRLQEAEERFGRAVELDSAFASALSSRAQTRYWSNRDYLLPHGPDISRWSTAAMRHLRGLSPRNERHVRAFYNLQLGQHDLARELYGEILRSDSTDAYALLMLGEIELLDRWLVQGPQGGLVPRSDLSRARRAFSSAVRMEPTLELAYGELFEVQRVLENALGNRGCPGFEELGDEVIPIWQRLRPDRMVPFCAVAADSLVWIPFAVYAASDKSAFRDGADRTFRQAVSELERWASFAPEQPRPLELLSEAYLVQRQQLGIAAPQRLQALAREALRYATRAVALRADTARAELVRLANLHLAAGQPQPAVELARRALDAYRGSRSADAVSAPSPLINVLVVAGQTSGALAVAAGTTLEVVVPDPETTEQIPLGEGVPILERLRVLVASGVSGSPVHRELELLEDAWARAGHTARQQGLLRRYASRAVAPALAFDSITLSAWSEGVTLDDPAGLALAFSDAEPSRARAAYARLSASRPPRADAASLFLLGVVAGRLGLHREAVEHYSGLDSIPHRVDTFDTGWGLQALSHLMRAGHYEALGDGTAAAAHLRTFIEAKSWPDSASSPLIDRAQSGARAFAARS